MDKQILTYFILPASFIFYITVGLNVENYRDFLGLIAYFWKWVKLT